MYINCGQFSLHMLSLSACISTMFMYNHNTHPECVYKCMLGRVKLPHNVYNIILSMQIFSYKLRSSLPRENPFLVIFFKLKRRLGFVLQIEKPSSSQAGSNCCPVLSLCGFSPHTESFLSFTFNSLCSCFLFCPLSSPFQLQF